MGVDVHVQDGIVPGLGEDGVPSEDGARDEGQNHHCRRTEGAVSLLIAGDDLR